MFVSVSGIRFTLVDGGTLDTEIQARQGNVAELFMVDNEIAAEYRDAGGNFSLAGFRQLCRDHLLEDAAAVLSDLQHAADAANTRLLEETE